MPEWGATLLGALIGAGAVLTLAGFGVAAAWGKVKQTLKNNEDKFAGVSEKITDVSKEVESLKRGLYKPDGTLIYVPAEACEKRRVDCGRVSDKDMLMVCKKIKELHEDVNKYSERLRHIEINVAMLAAKKAQKEVLNGQLTTKHLD